MDCLVKFESALKFGELSVNDKLFDPKSTRKALIDYADRKGPVYVNMTMKGCRIDTEKSMVIGHVQSIEVTDKGYSVMVKVERDMLSYVQSLSKYKIQMSSLIDKPEEHQGIPVNGVMGLYLTDLTRDFEDDYVVVVVDTLYRLFKAPVDTCVSSTKPITGYFYNHDSYKKAWDEACQNTMAVYYKSHIVGFMVESVDVDGIDRFYVRFRKDFYMKHCGDLCDNYLNEFILTTKQSFTPSKARPLDRNDMLVDRITRLELKSRHKLQKKFI